MVYKMSDVTNEVPPLFVCSYCNIAYPVRKELQEHCLEDSHRLVVMSDKGRQWRYRPPPRGLTQYTLCEEHCRSGQCRDGQMCVEAHSEEELVEWKERFKYREIKIKRAKKRDLYGKSYIEELQDCLAEAPNPSSLITDRLDGVLVESRGSPLEVTTSKRNTITWAFYIISEKPLRKIALLDDAHRSHFSITDVTAHHDAVTWLGNSQEKQVDESVESTNCSMQKKYEVLIDFTNDIYGTFRQTVVFDFGCPRVLSRRLSVEVVPPMDMEQLNEARQELCTTISFMERWTPGNSRIVEFSSNLVSPPGRGDENEKRLLETYACPNPETFKVSHKTFTEKQFYGDTYRERMHELLYVEEMTRSKLVTKYNIVSKLDMVNSYILCGTHMTSSAAKYSCDGELFATIALEKDLSEDSTEGRLILMQCNTLYLKPIISYHETAEPSCESSVYEAFIEDKGKDALYLRLSSQTVKELQLVHGSSLRVQVQFQLNRLPYCSWHHAIDELQNVETVFPDMNLYSPIPWTPQKHWDKSLDKRLNGKQREAIRAMTAPLDINLPPVLVIGPFGTGKTFTMAQGVKELLKDNNNKILICTHSNSAADLYIKEYIHDWRTKENIDASTLRIYYKGRWVQSINPIVRTYCLTKFTAGGTVICMPTLEEVLTHRIVVVTLSTSSYLSELGLKKGHFTHVIIDEAAQALECETITPLTLTGESTRIVLAGDHKQIGPHVYSGFASERGLQVSLLERLYYHYPTEFMCKVLLCENYRAHEDIVNFTSDLFYDQKLVTSSKQPLHGRFQPLTFFTARGEEVQEKNSTTFYNNSEVYEIIERVQEIKRSWPSTWGSSDMIGVVTPYSDQVIRIRQELRKHHLSNVNVERVLNVQGKQFRVIILSTVRTRKTCCDEPCNEADYGFLSNSKLLNTAMTRAQSLVAVVGDPIALCSVGKCSKVWERFLSVCSAKGSLHGISWCQLRSQLDAIELKKIYNLNPLAPEFIPRYLKNKNPQPGVQSSAVLLPPHNNVPYPVNMTQSPAAVKPASALRVSVGNNSLHLKFSQAMKISVQMTERGETQQHPNAVLSRSQCPAPAPVLSKLPNNQPMLNNASISNGMNVGRANVVVYSPGIFINSQSMNSHSVFNVTNQENSLVNNANCNDLNLTSRRGSSESSCPVDSSMPSGESREEERISEQPQPGSNDPISEMFRREREGNFLSPRFCNPLRDIFQFENNIHFPSSKQVIDCISLLPNAQTLSDIIHQPAYVREMWLQHLESDVGMEVTSKFRNLVDRILEKTVLNPSGSPLPYDNKCSFDTSSGQRDPKKPVYMRVGSDYVKIDQQIRQPLYKRNTKT